VSVPSRIGADWGGGAVLQDGGLPPACRAAAARRVMRMFIFGKPPITFAGMIADCARQREAKTDKSFFWFLFFSKKNSLSFEKKETKTFLSVF